MSHKPAGPARRLAAGLVFLALLAPATASATHRIAVPVSPSGTSSNFLAGSADGTKVLFATNDPLLPDQDQDSTTDIYLREGGQLTLISDLGQSEDDPAIFRAATPSLSHVVWETEQNFGLDFDNSADLYMWSGGQVERVTAGNSFSASNVTPYFNTRITADGSHVVFSATDNLGGEADTTADVYDYVNATNQLRLVSKPSAGTPVTLNAMSTDGLRVFMTTAAPMDATDTDGLDDVYVSINGAAPILLSPNTTQAVTFAGASADGTRAYFLTTESLNAVLDTDASRDIYETTVNGTANKLISAGNGPYDASFQRVSADGTRVFYTTREQILPADDDGEGADGFDDIYMREADTTTLITAGATLDAALVMGDISPDGHNVFWYSGQSFGDDQDGGALDAWRWNEGVITRISVGDINDEGDHDSSYAGRSADLSAFVFLSDGQLQLSAGEQDAFNDLYLREDGTTTLLTPALQPCTLLPSTRCAPVFNAMSADGGRIWFTTDESLHPADGDLPFDFTLTDVYESRVATQPVIDTDDSTLAHLEGDPEPIDPGVDITEAYDDLFGARVEIISGYEPTDVLAFDQDSLAPGIQGEVDGDTVRFTGRGTVAEFEAALRSVTYTTTSETPAFGPRGIEFLVNNGGHTASATRTLTVTPTDDPPLLTFLSGAADYTNGAGPVAIADLTVTDPDTATLTGATVKVVGGFVAGEDELGWTPVSGITAVVSDDGATLTFSGSASLAEYEALLKSVTYSNDAEVPTEGSRTFEFTAIGGAVQSQPIYHAVNVFRRNIDVANAVLVYTENAPGVAIDPGLTITNFPAETISGAVVEIVEGFAAGQDLLEFADQNGITASLSGGRLTLSGDATVAQYLAALRSVTYRNLSEAPTNDDRLIRFSLTGGLGFDSRRVDVVPVQDAPVVTGFSGALTFTEGGAFLPVAPELTIADVDSATLTGATLRIESGMQPMVDHLSPDLPSGISSSFDEATGTLTLTGTAPPADYQTALRSIVFFNDSDAPTSTTRQLVVTVTSGAATSAPVSRPLNVVPVNDAPAVGINATPLTFTTGDEPVAVDAQLALSDPDSQIQGATVKLIGEPVEGEDVLEVTDRDDGITVTVDELEQTVSFVGAASVTAYRTALREVLYANRSAAATGQRTVQVQVTDGSLVSTPVTRTIVLGTAAPALLSAPAIDGVARVGATLTAIDGGWSGSEPMTFALNWQRCAENGTGCVDIAGATGKTYAPAAADAGSKLRLRVVADNPADGTVEALSALTGVVRAALAAPLVTAGPPALTNKDSGVVRFSGEDGSTFTCSVDSAAFTACVSPLALAGLADGEHRVRVRQHRDGLTSAEAERVWTVDTSAPGAPRLLAGPDAETRSTSATIGFAGLPGERFECAIDGGDFTACESPVAYGSLAAGVHTVLVRAIDGAGNAGAPLRVRWTVDPNAVTGTASRLTLRAPKRISVRARAFGVGCRLDAGVLSKCVVVARVRRGRHLVRIGRGSLPAGVTGSSATVRVKLSRSGRRVLRRAGKRARIRLTGTAFQTGSDRRLVDTAALRAR